MPHLTFRTAGESHGPALIALVEGVPAGLPLLAAQVDHELARRQQGYGRGRRMVIETDRVEFLAGVRAGETLGAPVAMMIRNKDWANWEAIMDPAPRPEDEAPEGRKRQVTRVRPGHADLTGLLKFDRDDARDILERASARETTARVAAGAVAKALLAELGVRIGSHLVHLGGVDAKPAALPEDINTAADASPLRCLDADAEREMIARIDAAKADGNTLGGICEVVVTGLPVGLGAHVSWDRKLDGRLAAAICSIPAVKGVEMGMGFEAARRTGADVHDEIEPAPNSPRTGNVRRRTNRAGGLEGGMTTGEPLVLRVAMKPISTLMRPLQTVDVRTGEPAAAAAERSDVTAVPAMGVIAEAMAALVLADAALEKFGGDSVGEFRRNHDAYLARVAERLG
ncbi:MAG: chorismate synthase [Gemmatimonadaceae bacterium]|nr:chorismate synthase [Gemmatimonadaceae bacterium]MCW5826705.1 chorismate synthase [Gemmatimonadaceae bacterium]